MNRKINAKLIMVVMAREEESEAWGSWEDLLLGFAVKRHGLHDWDSVAAEVRTKRSLPRLLVTAHRCKLKFLGLKRRFASQNDAVLERHEDETIPWLDELRKLRVAELKQEVRNYDVSILSLETKVKRLEEERELNVRGNGISHGKPDLEELRERSENDKPERTGGESDREDRSVNESNTTGSKGKSGGEEVRLGLEPLRTGSYGPESEPVAEHSDDGSSDTVAKSQADAELRSDSAARESSEVQSSASLTRKRKRRGRRRREASGGLEPAETMEVTGKSKPFVRVLEMIRAHRSGSLFERRLESQESEEYKNLVKQHVDLETVESRLVKGTYSSCTLAFYRDLLLLFNNAALFFPKSSLESITAHQLRHLMLNEIPKRNNSFPKEHSPGPNAASLFQPKPELERSHSLLAKPDLPVPIIFCRKRSSISAKPNSSATTLSQKDKQASDEKTPALDSNSPPIKPSSDGSMLKTNAKEKPVTGVRSLRRSNKNPTSNNTSSASSKKQNSISPGSKPGLGNKRETPKTDQKNKTEALTLQKKRSAADFLKRIKWNSPGETVKSSGSKEQKRRHNGKGGDKKERRVLRQSSDRKVVKEESSPSKRSVGRPPRKVAEANAVSVKRVKESGGKEAAALKRPRKRARR